ncbi:ParA family protein [Corallococcus sp. AB038B]|uniref:ParA family protein n=1 Tax=Corallococcus sp. AB038B TaxID=2316718 RepID=UPI000EDCD78F|nr:ParA family protein [Corallococcus sp. AB038B]RKH98542.1 ParA family protein [Corallococcus sp. AB038B]
MPNATVVTVMNMKGGVGKSTVTAHLGGILARYRVESQSQKKVLLIDYDPQFNLSQTYIPATQYFALESANKTTLSIIQEPHKDLDPFQLQVPGNLTPPDPSALAHTIYSSKHGQLDIIPSTLDLMYVALGDTEKKLAPIEERFKKFITLCRSQYDIILIDCHPAGSIFTKTSLQNSDHVLIPVVSSRYAARGIGLMMKFIQAKSLGTNPKPHILFNSMPRNGIDKTESTIRLDKTLGPLCLPNTLKWYKVFEEPFEGHGFVWSSGKPYSTSAFTNLLSVSADFLRSIQPSVTP